MASSTTARASLLSLLSLLWVLPSASANPFLDKQPRIINGYDAPSGVYPYSVSLEDSSHFCGGALIGPNVVLTAAHCLGDPFKVRVGSDEVGEGELIDVAQTVEHPDYDSNTDEFDLALVFLEEAVTTVTEFARVNDDSAYPPVGSMAITMGWGDMDEGDNTDLPSDLQAVELEVISNDECADAEEGGDSYENWIYPSMVCTFTNGKDACQGDSGGPLVMPDPSGLDIIFGVVSWGVGCAFLPGVFARTSAGFDWLEDTVCNGGDTIDPQLTTVCGTPEPTNQPTNVPTPNPTNIPTRLPTKNPTNFPTRQPTRQPTLSPTTPAPTQAPTTMEPTASPTESPTDSPSISSMPTGSPSASPTVSTAPTTSPSASPSTSQRPSQPPSESPSISTQPSVAPSVSQSPTVAPSDNPTISSAPTISTAPTAMPSTSLQPTSSSAPSTQPSLRPSVEPTAERADRIDSFGNNLMIWVNEALNDIPGSDSGSGAAASALAPDTDNEDDMTSSSNRMGCNAIVGTLLSGLIAAWLVL